MVMLGAHSPGAPLTPEAKDVEVRGGDSTSQPCQEAWEAGACSLRESEPGGLAHLGAQCEGN